MRAQAAGDRAYSAGRYDEAARYYGQAAHEADRTHHRDEMLYMQAASWHRAGHHEQARAGYEQLERLSPGGERAARAAYEQLQIELEHGDKAKGYRMLEQFIVRYGSSSLGPRALVRYAGHLQRDRGTDAAIAYLRNGLPWFRAHELGEQAGYSLARLYEEAGQIRAARDMYVDTARRYPYPQGALFDDALFRAAELDEQLGQPHEAIAHLREMIREREQAGFGSSYERPRFAQAQYRIAEIYRDVLHDYPAAQREFIQLYRSFTKSVRRDDALWEAARLAVMAGDQKKACDLMRTLASNLPQSRYVPCAPLLCKEAKQPEGGRCRGYVERDWRENPSGVRKPPSER